MMNLIRKAVLTATASVTAVGGLLGMSTSTATASTQACNYNAYEVTWPTAGVYLNVVGNWVLTGERLHSGDQPFGPHQNAHDGEFTRIYDSNHAMRSGALRYINCF